MTDTSEAVVTPFAAVALAGTASRNWIRREARGAVVCPPAVHARRLVALLERIADEPYCASEEHSERILAEFKQRRDELAEVAPVPFRVVINYVDAS